MDKNKPIIGYDKFLLMALYKENPLSVMDLNDKTVISFQRYGTSSGMKITNHPLKQHLHIYQG